MVGHERRLDAIASNISNLGTTGFKRSSTAAHEFVVQRENGPVRGLRLNTETDFSQGNLRRTGHQYDLALDGEGFFAVEGTDGEVYTRSGTFKVTEQGVLTTMDDKEVAWNRRSGTIDPTGMPIRVGGDGVVRQGTQDLGQLKLVDFVDKNQLRQADGGYWTAPAGTKEATFTANVHQYSLEESNAAGVEEIVAMIGVQRAFESVANLTQSIQESYSRLTRSSF